MLDLREPDACQYAVERSDVVYNLAADMGGIGFIEGNKARCMLSILINTNLIRAAKREVVYRYFFASSACAYNTRLQSTDYSVVPLRESDVYPAMPEAGYGEEKLFSERMCQYFMEDYGLETRVARLHNVYGPQGTWYGGREKAPAAICRKVVELKESGGRDIEIWGNGMQKRSFMYIDDCVAGIQKIMNSDIREPINLGSSELVSIDGLVDVVAGIAGVEGLRRHYDLTAPKGVPGRNSDNTLIKQRLGWEPSIPLNVGLEKTYRWVEEEYRKQKVSRILERNLV